MSCDIFHIRYTHIFHAAEYPTQEKDLKHLYVSNSDISIFLMKKDKQSKVEEILC